VIAIAAGILHGIGYGVNSRAALITRGANEIARLGEAMNCHRETFWGLAGVGDLIVTATSELSRNFRFGFLVGKGKSIPEALDEIAMVVEGVETVKSTVDLSRNHGVDAPIVNKVYEILFQEKSPQDAVQELMIRDLKSE